MSLVDRMNGDDLHIRDDAVLATDLAIEECPGSSSRMKVKSGSIATADYVFQHREELGMSVGLLQKRPVGVPDLLRF